MNVPSEKLFRKGKLRAITRICHLLGFMVKRRLVPIPLDSREIADYLGISYQTFIRKIGQLAAGGHQTAFAVQGYHFLIFERHKASQHARNAHPQYYVISRYRAHTISETRTKAKLRGGLPWQRYFELFKNLLNRVLFKKKKRADDSHNGIPSKESGGGRFARPPPKANRPAYRRFKKLAVALQLGYNRMRGPKVNLMGWLFHRCAEGHDANQILRWLRHAVALHDAKKDFKIESPPAWIQAVALRHLERDGLAPAQRKRALRRNGAGAPTHKEGKQERIEIDKWIAENYDLETENPEYLDG
jgi:hypothetical protein